MNESTWTHLGIVAVPALMVLAMWLDSRRHSTQMHKQNQKKLDDLISEQKFLPQHYHSERTGPLTVDGIMRAPNGKRE